MSIILSLFILGVSLSMDTFSVFLSIGMFGISKKKILFLCGFIGLLHFIMPIIGSFIGNKIVTYLNVEVNILLGIILLFIAIEMLIDLIKNEDKIINLDILNMILISMSVSLDSFSTGIGLHAITDDYLLSGLIFSICASSFTYLGYIIGNYSSNKIGKYANVLGIVILVTISIIHIF
jgi:putative Mn2+ efflux pump MntP